MESRTESRTAAGAKGATGDGVSGNGTREEAPFSTALKSLGKLLGEAREYALYLASARVDSLRHSLKKAVILAAIGAVAGIAGIALIATAAVLAVDGLAGAVAALFGSGRWLGDLVVGLLVLIALGIGLSVAWGTLKRKSFEATRRKYEERQARERIRFGRGVAEQAARRAAEDAVEKAEKSRRAAEDAAESSVGRK